MTTPPRADEDEMTELVDADFPRVDLVGKGANGIPRFLIAKQDSAAGLLEPDFVRDLIAKTEPEASGRERVAMPNGVTLSGSPADIAAFIHKASQRADGHEQIAKAKYSADDKRKMLAAGHALKGPDGEPDYPIGDRDDLGKAIHGVGRGGAGHDHVRAYVIRRAKALGASSEIPDNWNSDGSLKAGVTKEAGVPVTAVTKDGAGDAFDAAVDDGQDGLDPTTPMAAPDDLDGIPGDPTDPGSAAWEAVDAATAVKWSTILAGAKRAVCWLMQREDIEAATVDPDDAGNACDLATVCDALDYAIGELAPYAVMEQSESDRLAFEASVAKSADPVSVTAAVVAIAKAGRVLSSANEGRIRQASQHLNDVLASLPQAPDEGGAAAVTKEEGAMPDTKTEAADVAKDAATPEALAADTGPVDAGGTTGLGEPRVTGPAAALPADGPQAALPGDAPGREVVKSSIAAVFDHEGHLVGVADPGVIVQKVEKADGEKPPMQAVFDQNGDLIGIVSPDAIQPVTGAGKAKPAEGDASDAGDAKDAAPAADASPAADEPAADMTPEPPADAGTPAGAVATDDDDVAKAAADGTQDVITVTAEVAKAIARDAAATALEAQGAAHQEAIAKMAADNGELAEELRVVKARLETVESQPAAPKVFTNGAVPPANQLRGQDQGAQPVDVAKAAELKRTLYTGTVQEQNQAFGQMQEMAVAKLAQMRAGS